MGANHPYASRYKEVAVKTANPLQLVVLLYDGAIQALQEAQEHLRHNDIAARSRCVNRSVSIISELQASLNFEVGGDISGALDRLYNYMKRRIFKANVEQRAEPLAEVVTLLANLRSAWNELAEQSRGKDTVAATASPTLPERAMPAPAASGALNISG